MLKAKIDKYKKIVLPLILIVLIFCATYLFFFHNKKPTIAELPLPTEAPIPTIPDKVMSLIEQVGQVVTLPTNEIPNVATVTDVKKLQDQVFFAKAKEGDKVLIYSIARKAFLYRPATTEIIEQAPVEIISEENEASMSAEGEDAATSEAVLRIRY